jgi:hypothetical protein
VGPLENEDTICRNIPREIHLRICFPGIDAGGRITAEQARVKYKQLWSFQ